MEKSELIKVVANKLNTTESEVKLVVNKFLKEIELQILDGVQINVNGLIQFNIDTVEARNRVNPKTKEVIHLPKQYKLKVKLSRTLKEKVAKKPVW